MSEEKPVKLFRYPPEEHGRKTPPNGQRYFAVLKTNSPFLTNEDWSVLLEFSSQTKHKYCRNAMLSFVSDQAPTLSLCPGYSFYLFEGRWPVAEGVILESSEAEV